MNASKMNIWFWEEEHRLGSRHFHIYSDELSQKKIWEKIIDVLETLREKYNLSWRNDDSLWDENKARMWIQVSLVRQYFFLFAYRLHITKFYRAKNCSKN